MVDVTRLPEGAFGYVPTPALVAPLEFTLPLEAYRAWRPCRGDPPARGGAGRRRRVRDRRPARTMAGARAMTARPVASLGDGRLHLHHGPIDVILEAFGPPRRCAPPMPARCALRRVARGTGRRAAGPAQREPTPVRGPVARDGRRVAPHRPVFVTPMAAVAGAVADALCAALAAAGDLRRAYANNGGDIALHLAPARA
jgi:hypothetical protein